MAASHTRRANSTLRRPSSPRPIGRLGLDSTRPRPSISPRRRSSARISRGSHPQPQHLTNSPFRPSRRVRLLPPCSGQLQRQSWPSRLAQPSALAMSAALMGPAVSADRDSERHPCGGAGRAFWNSAGKVFALLGLLLPSFRIGLVLSLVFSVYLGWLVVTPPCRFGLNVRTLGEG